MDWNKYNILGVIQARGGSKGIPKKNIKDINGKPLISYTIAEALKTKIFNHFVVSSDDGNILDLSERFGSYSLKRPEKLAGDNILSVDSLFVFSSEIIFSDRNIYLK